MAIIHLKLPTVTNKSSEEIDALIKRLNQSNLSAEEQDFFTGCVELATWLPEALREKEISIKQLRCLLFGNSSSSKKKKKKKSNSTPPETQKDMDATKTTAPEGNSTEISSSTSTQTNCDAQAQVDQVDLAHKRGHGRIPANAYANAIFQWVNHLDLKPGDFCPSQCGGKLYRVLKPGTLIRVTGNTLATVYRYEVERLRCALCGEVFGAKLPDHVCGEKYDPLFKAIIATQKYYMGVPFYRQEHFQYHMKLPLPASTQFELCEQVADCGYRVVKELEKGIANGKGIQHDDTHVKILSVMKDNEENPDKERTGMYTSCLMGMMEEHPVALYYTGQKHGGENLDSVLEYRDRSKPPIIQMVDASSMNLSKKFETILCNCLGHGFRKFRDLLDFYPEPCLYVIKALDQVFKYDEETKDMDELERFQFHRRHSKPIMLELNRWLKRQFSEKRVEPNSSLGRAIKYMLRHWKNLRRFLVVPGCFIDNNLVERALKIPIRVRKASMFYKTEYGALIGGILTSLIHTAILSNENPIEYLVALQENKSQVFQNPRAWLPWCYRETLRAQKAIAQAA